jgi:hypothetical protein
MLSPFILLLKMRPLEPFPICHDTERAGSAATILNGGGNYQGGVVYGFVVGGKVSRLGL